jgi:hypothetical protein
MLTVADEETRLDALLPPAMARRAEEAAPLGFIVLPETPATAVPVDAARQAVEFVRPAGSTLAAGPGAGASQSRYRCLTSTVSRRA